MKLLLVSLAAACSTFALPAFAADDMAGMNMKSPGAMSAPKPVDAEVRKVDAANGKVTLKHGPIENLGMSAMTMTFPVKDKTNLATLKEGDKVRATFDTVKGVPTVTEISHR
jgi:Cu/Ag efflux protein CusF